MYYLYLHLNDFVHGIVCENGLGNVGRKRWGVIVNLSVIFCTIDETSN